MHNFLTLTLPDNDAQGVTERFILNALSVVNRVGGLNFRERDWVLDSKYDPVREAVIIQARCVKACEVRDGNVLVRRFSPGETIFVEQRFVI
jgi:uncharacterized SAM-dependent methyltransferase